MKLQVGQTNRFKKQMKLMKKRGCDVSKLRTVVNMLAEGKVLPEKYRNHKLSETPRFRECWECHVEPDWLLVYQIFDDELLLLLFETGTHSDLF